MPTDSTRRRGGRTTPLRARQVAFDQRDFIVDLMACDSFETLGEVFRSGLARLVPADLHEILVFNTGVPTGDVFLGTPGGFTAKEKNEMLEYLNGRPERHPVTKYCSQGEEAFPVQVTDLVSLREWRNTEFYNRYNRRWGHDHELDCLTTEPGLGATLAISIARGTRSYDDREVDTLRRMIRPVSLTIGRMMARRMLDRWVSGKSLDAGLLQKMFPRLTFREAEVLSWLAEGKSDPEIAGIMGMKRMTTSTHVRNIITKLEVENRLSAAMMAVRRLVGQRAGQFPENR